MIGSNLHTHSIFSDGSHTPDRVVRSAIARGMHTLGFSEHSPVYFDDASVPPTLIPAYRREVRRLQTVYGEKLNILLGYEHEYFSPYIEGDWDYIIESVHFFHINGEYYPIDHRRSIMEDIIRDCFAGDPYAMCKNYFDMICDSCVHHKGEILGHMELIMKFNEHRDLFDDNHPRYLKAAREAVAAAKESGMIVEINTGAISRGYRTMPTPDKNITQMLVDAGVPLMLNSDSHREEWLDYAFDTALQMLRECGCKSVFEYHGKTPTEISL